MGRGSRGGPSSPDLNLVLDKPTLYCTACVYVLSFQTTHGEASFHFTPLHWNWLVEVGVGQRKGYPFHPSYLISSKEAAPELSRYAADPFFFCFHTTSMDLYCVVVGRFRSHSLPLSLSLSLSFPLPLPPPPYPIANRSLLFTLSNQPTHYGAKIANPQISGPPFPFPSLRRTKLPSTNSAPTFPNVCSS